MLKQLRIKNFILIESAEIPFQKGFNVISGETGAGKSAIMGALNLIAGDRADHSLIRKGMDKGTIEAVFDIDHIHDLLDLLNASGIDHEAGGELILRRELVSQGKGRIFINNQIVQRTILTRICEKLFSIVGQHANQKLLSTDAHREILDTYGCLHARILAFKALWDEENAIKKELTQLIQNESQRLRDIEVCRMELEELDEANLKEGEEEELFAEYTILSNAQELAEHSQEVVHLLTNEKLSVLNNLKKGKLSLTELSRLDPSMSETLSSYDAALMDLQEVAYILQRYQDKIDSNPAKANKINERLTLITKLKRKYGDTIASINAYRTQCEAKLYDLENADFKIEELKEKLAQLSTSLNQTALALTTARKQTAKRLEKGIITHLRSLNMAKVEFFIDVAPQKRSSQGDDLVEFYLIPNVGEHKVPIKECASGGELSRIMLAIQTLLAGKEKTATLIFDEIDSNIGGETATDVGEKLQEIGKAHQVLCITHFPQVASQAHHHLKIAKHEKEGRTITMVHTLDATSKKTELSRMRGEKPSSVKA